MSRTGLETGRIVREDCDEHFREPLEEEVAALEVRIGRRRGEHAIEARNRSRGETRIAPAARLCRVERVRESASVDGDHLDRGGRAARGGQTATVRPRRGPGAERARLRGRASYSALCEGLKSAARTFGCDVARLNCCGGWLGALIILVLWVLLTHSYAGA